MSYDIRLVDVEGRPMEVATHQEGGTFVVGGTTEAELNVTTNYTKHFSFEKLHRQTAKAVTPILQWVVEDFGTQQSEDYWDATKGNVGYALKILLRWAQQYPEAVFTVS